MSKLTIIQSRLKAPKNQINKFGGYSYRSCEDILEAVKPLLAETGCHLIMKDEIVNIGERFYVRAEVYLFDEEKLLAMTQAYAREAAEKRGMDPAQQTGSCSSYARKVALSGLLLCDDNKDADCFPPPGKEEKDHKSDEQRQKEINERIELMKKTNLLNAKKFQGDLQQKMVSAINDPKFNSINGQETLAKRIKEQLLKQVENMPPPPPRPSVKSSHFTIPENKSEERKETKKEIDDKKPEDFF